MPAYLCGKKGAVGHISQSYPFSDISGHGMQAPMELTCAVAAIAVGPQLIVYT